MLLYESVHSIAQDLFRELFAGRDPRLLLLAGRPPPEQPRRERGRRQRRQRVHDRVLALVRLVREQRPREQQPAPARRALDQPPPETHRTRLTVRHLPFPLDRPLPLAQLAPLHPIPLTAPTLAHRLELGPHRRHDGRCHRRSHHDSRRQDGHQRAPPRPPARARALARPRSSPGRRGGQRRTRRRQPRVVHRQPTDRRRRPRYLPICHRIDGGYRCCRCLRVLQFDDDRPLVVNSSFVHTAPPLLLPPRCPGPRRTT